MLSWPAGGWLTTQRDGLRARRLSAIPLLMWRDVTASPKCQTAAESDVRVSILNKEIRLLVRPGHRPLHIRYCPRNKVDILVLTSACCLVWCYLLSAT